MKIYNKKRFWQGVGFCLLAAVSAVVMVDKGVSLRLAVCALLSLAFGMTLTARGLSREMTREDLREEQDERNQMVAWRAKSRAFGIAEIICGAGLLLSIVGTQAPAPADRFCGGMTVAFGAMMTAMLACELGSVLYYNRKL